MSLYIQPEIVEKIKEIRLIDYIENHYTPLKRSGKEFKGLCPNHDERSPSFFVNEKNEFCCFGCDFKGAGTIDFEKKLNKLPFLEAVQTVATLEGLTIGEGFAPIPKKEKTVIHDETVFLPLDVVNRSLNNYKENDYATYLLSIFDIETVGRLLNTFKIGTLHAVHSFVKKKYSLGNLTNAVIFYYIDEKDRVTFGKTMVYDSTTGKRGKGEYQTSSLHFLLDYQKPKHAFFGLHQLSKERFKTVRIVESENTAIVMTGLYPNYVWLATGSASNLNLSNMIDLDGRNVEIYPDRGQFESWNQLTNEFREWGFNVVISDFLEHLDVPKNYDILDWIRDQNAQIQANTPKPTGNIWIDEFDSLVSNGLAFESLFSRRECPLPILSVGNDTTEQ
jgi:Domain of unknown function (DUF6371)/CHC2 zinc finger